MTWRSHGARPIRARPVTRLPAPGCAGKAPRGSPGRSPSRLGFSIDGGFGLGCLKPSLTATASARQVTVPDPPDSRRRAHQPCAGRVNTHPIEKVAGPHLTPFTIGSRSAASITGPPPSRATITAITKNSPTAQMVTTTV
jgi:hypothetical protein